MTRISVSVVATPLRVIEWTTKSKRVITAVCAPQTFGDTEPWALYEGDQFLGRFSSESVPANAKVRFEGVNAGTKVADGVYYEVIVDGRPGVGVRNGPLSEGDTLRPWVVRLYGDHHGGSTVDSLPDEYVQVNRPIDHE